MSGPDLNLLFGMLALQLDFITRDQLIAAMQAWVLDKARPLGDLLREQGVLSAERQQLLGALVQEHLRNHGDDPQKSLAALSSGGSAAQALRDLQDPDLEASLAHVGVAGGDTSGNPTTISYVSDQADAARFRVIRRHAEGGLGIVYLARDMEVGRVVALKEIKPQHVENPNSRSRFVLEAEITGGLEHPGIVPVYGLGHYADGRPYYAMRFIKGDSLKDAIEAFHAADTPRPDGTKRDATERDLALRQLLRRFIDVCNAIDYAHSKGVLHRDLKPGNIMLGKYGETLVVDWGLAKAGAKPESTAAQTLDSSEAPLEPSSGSGVAATQMGSAIGTPPFMPPEQAAGRLDLLGPASDVYSLGATLYSLLTGELAFPQKDIVELFKSIERGTFRRPREVKPAIDPGLEAVCLKAMAREPGDRYPSAAALRKDLENWIADAPVDARPDPLSVKVRRWIGRHKVLAATSLASLVLAAVFLGVLAYVTGKANEDLAELADKERTQKNAAIEQSRIAKEQTKIAKEQTELAQKRADELEERSRSLSIATGFAADGAFERGEVEKANENLDQIPEKFRGWEWHYRKRHFQGSYMTLYGHSAGVNSASYSPDGGRIVSASDDKTIKVWDARTGAELLTLRGHTGRVTSASYSPDGGRIVSASDDKTIKVWDVRTEAELLTLRGNNSYVSSSYSPDGRRILSGSGGGMVKVWNAQTGEELLTLHGHNSPVSSSYSPDGRRILSGGGAGTLKVWDAQSGAELLSRLGPKGPDNMVASYSPDGDRIVIAADTLKVWDARTGAELLILNGHNSIVSSATYSPDGSQIASGSWDRTLKVFDARKGTELFTLRGHVDSVNSASYSPDGSRIVSGSRDGTLKVWDARTGAEVLTLRGHSQGVESVSYSRDGSRIASGSGDATIKVWDSRTGTDLLTLRGHNSRVRSARCNPDGSRIVSGSEDKTLKVWDARTGAELLTLLGHFRSVNSAAYSPDGNRIVSGSDDAMIKVWDARTGAELLTLRGHTSPVTSASYSPDGSQIMSSGLWDFTVKVWNASTGAELFTLRGHTNEVYSASYNPDGSRIVSGSGDATIKVWDARTGTELLTLRGHTDGVRLASYSPDGSRIVSRGDRTLKVWDARTGTELLTLRGYADRASSASYSPDGSRIVSGSTDKTLKVWVARSGTELLTLRGHNGVVRSASYSPDGSRIVSGGLDQTLKVWDARSGTELLTLRGHTDEVRLASYSPDGSRIVSGDFSGAIKVWNSLTGEELRETPPAELANTNGRHPKLPQLAVPVGTTIRIVDVGPLSEDERLFREAMARFDPVWHREQAEKANSKEPSGAYASVFHLRQIALNVPTDAKNWEELIRASDAGGRLDYALGIADRAIAASPAAEPAYRARAQLRARSLQFAAASADDLTSVILRQRQRAEAMTLPPPARPEESKSPPPPHLAICLPNGPESTTLYLASAAGPGLASLSKLSSQDQNPCWSPGGKLLAFDSNRDLSGRAHIHVMDAGGGDVRQLTAGDAPCIRPSWTADGRVITFMRQPPNVAPEIWVMDANGKNQKKVRDGYDAAISPDGKSIAFTEPRNGHWRLFTMKVDGTGFKQISKASNPGGFVWPAWSPDGKRIVFGAASNGKRCLFIVDADGSNEKKLTTGDAEEAYAAWSPDGKQISFFRSKPTGVGRIWVMNADGSGPRELLPFDVPWELGRIAWRPENAK